MKGSFVAIITPFLENNTIDEEALRKLVNWHVENKTDGIVCAGTTGEGITLSFEEKLKVFKICIEESRKRLYVVGGTGSSSTKESVELTKKAKDLGLDAALAIVPYYNRPTDKGCFFHFAEIGKVGLDIILYENPIRTGKTLGLPFYQELKKIPQIRAIKASVGNIEDFKTIQNVSPIPLFAGDDHLILEALSVGASGCISVLGNIMPKEIKDLISFAFAKNWKEAMPAFQKLKPLIKALGLETNPQMVKYAACLLGKCKLQYRLPLIEPSLENQGIMKQTMQDLNLLKPFVHN